MKKIVIASVVALVAVSVAVTAAFAGSSKSAAEAKACVLLPDTKSSVRWQTQDRPDVHRGLQEGRHLGHGRERRG